MQRNLVSHERLPLAMIALLAAVSVSAQTPQIDQGRAALARGESDAAIAALEKAVAQDPNRAEAHYYLATAYGNKVQEIGMLGAMTYASKIMNEFEKAVALNPAYVEARMGLVQAYAAAPEMMGGSIDKALEQAKAIKRIDPIVGHRAYAFVYSQQKKPDLAKNEYLDAIREQPDSPKAHIYYGQYLVSVEKNYAPAFSEFETALKVSATFMAAYYQIGRAAALADSNLARGEASLKKYLAYTPKENEPALANAHYYLGSIYEQQGKKAEARQSYQAALKLNPTLKLAIEALKRVS